MVFSEVLQRFVEKSPVSVMFRATLENMVTAEVVDEIFVKTARRQYAHELLFSVLVYLLSLVVVRTRRSVNDAYVAEKERYVVSVAAVYGKLQETETEVSRQLVRQTAERSIGSKSCERSGPAPCPVTRWWSWNLTSTGVVYEERLRLHHPDGRELLVRRIHVKLFQPTQDGDTEIYLLTNLRQRVAGALTVPQLYLERWTVENAFQELEQSLHSEIGPLAYPRAALLSFCVALLTYNVVSVVKSALAAVHGEAAERRTLSGYYLAGEIATTYQGMMAAVPPREWRRFGHLTSAGLARVLKQLAAGVSVERFRKNVRGPKKPRPKPTSGKRQKHVSTAKILAQRKQAKKHAVTA